MPNETAVSELRQATLKAMRDHLQLASELHLLTPQEPLQRARLAFQLGEAELAWALIALSGGLFDQAERNRILREPVEEGLIRQAAECVSVRSVKPEWTDTQREMYVRILAGVLTQDSQHAVDFLDASSGLPAGLWRFPVTRDLEPWRLGLRLIREMDKPGAELPTVRWACSSWGRQLGLRHFLRDQERPAHIEVMSLEQVIGALSAAWSWDLSQLPQLLSRPLLMEGLETLSAERLETLASLLDDCAQLFGWTVVIFPTMARRWPQEFQPYPAPNLEELPPRRGDPDLLAHFSPEQSLAELFSSVAAHSGRSLVVLYSRASAARLARSLPGSVLLSSSLCRVHLEEQMSALAKRQDEPDLTVIATTLPSSPLGQFDRVWHLSAPLPFLHEAVQLSRSPLSIVRLSDVVVPSAWYTRAKLTERLFEEGDPLNDPLLQQAYFDQLDSQEAQQGAKWRDFRLSGQYASLASELNAQTEHSLPVLIPFNEEARQAIADYRRTGWLPRRDLRFVAWMTPTELRQAIKTGAADQAGWAAVWQGTYDPVFGLSQSYLT